MILPRVRSVLAQCAMLLLIFFGVQYFAPAQLGMPATPYICTAPGTCYSIVGAPGVSGAPGPPGPPGAKGDPGSVTLSGAVVSVTISQRNYMAWSVPLDASPAQGAQFGSYTIAPPAEGLGKVIEVFNAGLEQGEGREYDVIGSSVLPRSAWKGPVDIHWTGR